MLELAKFVGGVSWIVGVLLLFIVPEIGWVVLLVALLATIWVTTKTRERRHQELLAAQGRTESQAPASVSDRLAELDKIREAGGLSDEEYQDKRQQILDSL